LLCARSPYFAHSLLEELVRAIVLFGFGSALRTMSFFVVVLGFAASFLEECVRDTIFFGSGTQGSAASQSSKASAVRSESTIAYVIRGMRYLMLESPQISAHRYQIDES
jgi:hypothetical protein